MRTAWLLWLIASTAAPLVMAAPTTDSELARDRQINAALSNMHQLDTLSFNELLARAKQEATTFLGAPYDQQVGEYTQRKFGDTVRQCEQTVDHPSKIPVTLAMIVAADGKVSNILVSPKTNAVPCIISTLKAGTMPIPPSAPYPVYIEWQF